MSVINQTTLRIPAAGAVGLVDEASRRLRDAMKLVACMQAQEKAGSANWHALEKIDHCILDALEKLGS